MIETLTLALATPIAKAILDKFYEGAGSKLGEKAVELVPEKVKQLGQLLWNTLRHTPDAEKLLNNAVEGSTTDQQELAQRLEQALAKDSELLQEAQKLAETIYQTIQIGTVAADNVQQVFGGEAEQFNNKTINAPTVQGGSGHQISITINNNAAPVQPSD